MSSGMSIGVDIHAFSRGLLKYLGEEAPIDRFPMQSHISYISHIKKNKEKLL